MERFGEYPDFVGCIGGDSNYAELAYPFMHDKLKNGKAPSLCMLVNKGYMRTVVYHQREVLEAGISLTRTEWLVAAPETWHASRPY